MTLDVRRLGVWGGPAGFGLFFVFLTLAEPNAGGRAFYSVGAVVSGYFFARAWRVGATIGEASLVVHGQFRTRRLDLARIERASLEPMRTASPLGKQFPYVAVCVDLDDGRHIQFEELSAAESDQARLDAFVSALNARLDT